MQSCRVSTHVVGERLLHYRRDAEVDQGTDCVRAAQATQLRTFALSREDCVGEAGVGDGRHAVAGQDRHRKQCAGSGLEVEASESGSG